MNKQDMKKPFAFLLANLLFSGCGLLSAPQAFADHSLAKNGKTSYVISLASDAIPAEKTAAEQLQKYLQQVTGAAFPIRSESETEAKAPQILVGAGPRVKSLLPNQNWAALGSDGIVIKTVGNSLVLAGGRPRSSLYAVYEFLEKSVGIRWWTPTESFIPKRSLLTVPNQNITYKPAFAYREHYTTMVQEDPIFATKMRENGHFQTQDASLGGHYNILGSWCHTFGQLLDVEVYFKDHPEWYSDPSNGNKPCTANSPRPTFHNSQLNLSNPEVLEELTKNALALIEKSPEAGYISISQNDNRNFCQDPESVALVKAEGSESAPILNFVNKVAAKIHEKYPDFLVETLAYNGTEKPPKTIRPGRNVIVRMAPIWSDYGHPLNSDWNPDIREYLTEWSKIAPNLFVWNYVTNFDNLMVTHPNWDGIGKDVRFFAANNVQGLFQQGDDETNSVGDFVQLRAWLISKLMWNPALDQEALTNEFLKGYYGPAAPYLKQYLDGVQKSFLSQNKKLSTYNRDFSFFTLDVANQSIQLFDKAEAAVKNDKELLYRVRRERLSMRWTLLYRHHALVRAAAQSGKTYLGPKDPQADLVDFEKTATEFKVGEGADLKNQVPRLMQMLAPPVPLPEFAKGYLQDDIIDLQPATFSLHERGTLSDIVNDPKASDGKATSLLGDAHDWLIQAPAGRFLDSYKDKWRIYAVARVERNTALPAKDVPRQPVPNQEPPEPNMGFQIGLYDRTTHKNILNDKGVKVHGIPMERMADPEYQYLDLGVYDLDSAEIFVYVQPLHNPEVSKIYVDRIVLMRQK